MSIRNWIHDREIRGRTTFCTGDVVQAFNAKSAKYLNKELSRLVNGGRVQSVYRGFYVIVPVQYQLKGVVPPTYYIDNLMQHVSKPYYVALLSAATFHGATHQRAMKTQVITVAPRIRKSAKNLFLDWNYRQRIPENFLMRKKTECGTLLCSNPELTAIDLIQFSNHVGGLQRSATILDELMDSVDIKKMTGLAPFTTVSTLQRLGYILEFILQRQDDADSLFEILKAIGRWNSIRLSQEQTRRDVATSNRWHVNKNIDIELDDL